MLGFIIIEHQVETGNHRKVYFCHEFVCNQQSLSGVVHHQGQVLHSVHTYRIPLSTMTLELLPLLIHPGRSDWSIGYELLSLSHPVPLVIPVVSEVDHGQGLHKVFFSVITVQTPVKINLADRMIQDELDPLSAQNTTSVSCNSLDIKDLEG